MASRATIEPNGGHRNFFMRLSIHCCPRILFTYGKNSGCLIDSATDLPFSNNAPVGHTCTHFPQLVHEVELPHCSFKSVITRQPTPRPMTSQVCAPSISSQTRTQRVQRIQRFGSRVKSLCDASTWRRGEI